MLLQIFSLILHFAVGLIAGTCLLRLYMQAMRVNLSRSSGNPLAPFVFAITDWLVLPLRRFVPAIGRIDTASLLAAYAVLLAKHALVWLVVGASTEPLLLLPKAALELVSVVLSGLMWLVLIYVLMSWMRTASDAAYFLAQLVEPLLEPIRRVLPRMGGVDLSPIAVLLLIQIGEIVLHGVRTELML